MNSLQKLYSIATTNIHELKKELANLTMHGFEGTQEPQRNKTFAQFVTTMRSILAFLKIYFDQEQVLSLTNDKEIIRACKLPKEQTDMLLQALSDAHKIENGDAHKEHTAKKIMAYMPEYGNALEACLKETLTASDIGD